MTVLRKIDAPRQPLTLSSTVPAKLSADRLAAVVSAALRQAPDARLKDTLTRQAGDIGAWLNAHPNRLDREAVLSTLKNDAALSGARKAMLADALRGVDPRFAAFADALSPKINATHVDGVDAGDSGAHKTATTGPSLATAQAIAPALTAESEGRKLEPTANAIAARINSGQLGDERRAMVTSEILTGPLPDGAALDAAFSSLADPLQRDKSLQQLSDAIAALPQATRADAGAARARLDAATAKNEPTSPSCMSRSKRTRRRVQPMRAFAPRPNKQSSFSALRTPASKTCVARSASASPPCKGRWRQARPCSPRSRAHSKKAPRRQRHCKATSARATRLWARGQAPSPCTLRPARAAIQPLTWRRCIACKKRSSRKQRSSKPRNTSSPRPPVPTTSPCSNTRMCKAPSTVNALSSGACSARACASKMPPPRPAEHMHAALGAGNLDALRDIFDELPSEQRQWRLVEYEAKHGEGSLEKDIGEHLSGVSLGTALFYLQGDTEAKSTAFHDKQLRR